MILRVLTLALFSTTALAQTPQPLPSNYQTILDNNDVLVMRVHYGPHEFVPMHDHSAYPTVFVYLNNSGEVRIDHEPPNAFSVTRPPTHTGAFRIAPGMKERHSITNLSDLPSDFLRVELKSIPPDAIKDAFRGPEPSQPIPPGITVWYKSSVLRVDRILCAVASTCTVPADDARSVLVSIPLGAIGQPPTNPVTWLPAHSDLNINIGPGTGFIEVLRILFPQS